MRIIAGMRLFPVGVVGVGCALALIAGGCAFNDATEVEAEYIAVARPALAVASDVLLDLGLDAASSNELPAAGELPRGSPPDYPEGCDCYVVSLGEMSSLPVDRDYRVPFDAIEQALTSAGIAYDRTSRSFGAEVYLFLNDYSWMLVMEANRKARTIEVYAYGSIDSWFESHSGRIAFT